MNNPGQDGLVTLSTTSTVADFLVEIGPARRHEIERVRSVIRRHLPRGYEETLRKRMIVYEVPLGRYSDTYNGHPLWYAALASEKSHLALHLLNVYGDTVLADRLKAGFRAAGKKLDMGKTCIRFQSADDLALDVIGEIVASTSLDRFVEIAKAARR